MHTIKYRCMCMYMNSEDRQKQNECVSCERDCNSATLLTFEVFFFSDGKPNSTECRSRLEIFNAKINHFFTIWVRQSLMKFVVGCATNMPLWILFIAAWPLLRVWRCPNCQIHHPNHQTPVRIMMRSTFFEHWWDGYQVKVKQLIIYCAREEKKKQKKYFRCCLHLRSS